jgi:hypothetical protein
MNVFLGLSFSLFVVLATMFAYGSGTIVRPGYPPRVTLTVVSRKRKR